MSVRLRAQFYYKFETHFFSFLLSLGNADNVNHKAGGGKTKVFDEKQDYSNVKSKAGDHPSRDFPPCMIPLY